jgi:hypothetical protein
MLRKTCLSLILLVSVLSGDGWHSRINANTVPDKTSIKSNDMQNLRERYNYTHEMDGEMAKAFIAAYLDFQNNTEIPQNKRDIANYTVKMKKDKDKFRILFYAKRTKVSPGKGGESELGRDVEYEISSTDYKVIRRSYFK